MGELESLRKLREEKKREKKKKEYIYIYIYMNKTSLIKLDNYASRSMIIHA